MTIKPSEPPRWAPAMAMPSPHLQQQRYGHGIERRAPSAANVSLQTKKILATDELLLCETTAVAQQAAEDI